MLPRKTGAVKHLRNHKKYFVPDTHPPRCAGWGYFNQGVFRSIRTSSGRRYDGDEIAVLEYILNQIEHDQLPTIEVQINYNQLRKTVCYRTSVATLREHGRRVPGVSGWELAMPRTLWSIDGHPPKAEPVQMNMFGNEEK